MKSDGAVLYESGRYAPKKIDDQYRGNIGKKELGRLVDLLYENDFFSMNGKRYDNPKILDASTTKTTVRSDGKEYQVSEYDAAGPERLHRINKGIWSLKDRFKARRHQDVSKSQKE
ncbi:MAG: hypothetical protein HZC29_00195 [Thaumarchaeota archaeon]|nr:hypothetical protein [Nitrososphaerota archaeon]